MKPILKIIEKDEGEDEHDKEESNLIEHDKEESKIKVIKPITDSTTFETVDEFNEYYASNKKIFEENTTCKLNKMFKIDGFKITKIKGVVSLKSIPQSRVTALMMIEDLTKRINVIEDRINQIIAVLNST